PSAESTQILQMVHGQLDAVDRHLEWARKDVADYMRRLEAIARTLPTRRGEILRERELDAAIGFPVRRRPDASRYAVPVRRKKIPPGARGPVAGPFPT